MPHDRGNEILLSEDLIHYGVTAVLFSVVEMHPDRAVGREQLADLEQPLAHHRQPDRALERVVVVLERLLRVEGLVEVGELHLADVLAGELGSSQDW